MRKTTVLGGLCLSLLFAAPALADGCSTSLQGGTDLCKTYAPKPVYSAPLLHPSQPQPDPKVFAPVHPQAAHRPAHHPVTSTQALNRQSLQQVISTPPPPGRVVYVEVPQAQPVYRPQPVYHAPQPQQPPVRIVEAPRVYAAPCDKTIDRLRDTRDGERRYSVCYSDLLGFTEFDRNRILVERIERAADRACDVNSSSILSRYGRAERACEREAVEEAVLAANVPGLGEYYFRGQPRPNVTVGPLIYR